MGVHRGHEKHMKCTCVQVRLPGCECETQLARRSGHANAGLLTAFFCVSYQLFPHYCCCFSRTHVVGTDRLIVCERTKRNLSRIAKWQHRFFLLTCILFQQVSGRLARGEIWEHEARGRRASSDRGVLGSWNLMMRKPARTGHGGVQWLHSYLYSMAIGRQGQGAESGKGWGAVACHNGHVFLE